MVHRWIERNGFELESDIVDKSETFRGEPQSHNFWRDYLISEVKAIEINCRVICADFDPVSYFGWSPRQRLCELHVANDFFFEGTFPS